MDDFDFEAPSFSLGIDLDNDDDNNHADADLVVNDSDPEHTADESFKRKFKRLRNTTTATTTPPPPAAAAAEASAGPLLNSHRQVSSSATDWDVVEEEIEDFSSQEEDTISAQDRTTCSTSKTSLSAQGSVVVNRSTRKLQSSCQNEASVHQINHKGETNGDKLKIPRLTVSPVRKFLLVESDSEDFTDFVKEDTLPKRVRPSGGLAETFGKRSVKESCGGSHQNNDLWNDFVSPKSFTISTPVLDKVCEEYFHTLKDKEDEKYPQHHTSTSNHENVSERLTDLLIQQNSGLQGAVPPAHRYYFHDDTRIQNLVRSRLPNFFPLVDVDNRGDNLLGTPNIDYRSQFDQGGSSTSRKQTNKKRNVEVNSTKGRRKNKNTAENVSQASQSWVNPKVRASSSTPRDANQKRVRADGSSNDGCPKKASSMGHWFTGSDGKRVYVSASGQELTGRLAYMNYKKENGGFKKSRKKAAAKKK